MEDLKLYRSNLENKFPIHFSFWSGILSFFTQSSPYDEAIDKIHKMEIQDAFKSDVQQLHRDFQIGCKKNHLLPRGTDCDKQLVDACE
jgi:hypothetical protein